MTTPQWWLYSDGHVLSGAIVVRTETNIEAQILLDGALIYGSRHGSRDGAAQVLADMHGQWTQGGWAETLEH